MLDKESQVFGKPFPSCEEWETAVELINEIANAYINKDKSITFDYSTIEVYNYFSQNSVSVGLRGDYKGYTIHEIITQYGIGVRYEEMTKLFFLIGDKLSKFAKYSAKSHPRKSDINDNTKTCPHCTDNNSCFFHYLCNELYINQSPGIAIFKAHTDEVYEQQPHDFIVIYNFLSNVLDSGEREDHNGFISSLLKADDGDQDLLNLGKKLGITTSKNIKKKLTEYINRLQVTASSDTIEKTAGDKEASSPEAEYIKKEEASSAAESPVQTAFREFFVQIGTNDDGRCVLGTYAATEGLILKGLSSWEVREASRQYYLTHKNYKTVPYTVINYAEIKGVLQNSTRTELPGIVQNECPCCENESPDCDSSCEAHCDVECSHVQIACEVTEHYYRDIACWMFSLHKRPAVSGALMKYAKELGYNIISELDYRIIKTIREQMKSTNPIMDL